MCPVLLPYCAIDGTAQADHTAGLLLHKLLITHPLLSESSLSFLRPDSSLIDNLGQILVWLTNADCHSRCID